jgi:hypothetical protein
MPEQPATSCFPAHRSRGDAVSHKTRGSRLDRERRGPGTDAPCHAVPPLPTVMPCAYVRKVVVLHSSSTNPGYRYSGAGTPARSDACL